MASKKWVLSDPQGRKVLVFCSTSHGAITWSITNTTHRQIPTNVHHSRGAYPTRVPRCSFGQKNFGWPDCRDLDPFWYAPWYRRDSVPGEREFNVANGARFCYKVTGTSLWTRALGKCPSKRTKTISCLQRAPNVHFSWFLFPVVCRTWKRSFFRKATIPSGYTYLWYDTGAPSTFWKHCIKKFGKKQWKKISSLSFFLRFAVEKLPLQNGHNWYSIWFQTTRQARAPPRRRQSTATTSKNALKSSSSPFFSSVYLIFLDWKEINIDHVHTYHLSFEKCCQ